MNSQDHGNNFQNHPLSEGRSIWFLLTRNTEGRILLCGLSLLFVCLIGIAIGWLWFPAHYHKFISLTGTRFVVGRPATVFLGYVLGVGYGPIFVINMLVDALAVFLLYPLFVFGYQHMDKTNALKRFIKRVWDVAQRHHKVVQKYGIPGLFVFVLIPIWGTGPVVGSAMGLLMQMKSWANLGVVLSATALAIIIWMMLLTEFHQWLLFQGSQWPIEFIVFVILITLSLHQCHHLRKDKSCG